MLKKKQKAKVHLKRVSHSEMKGNVYCLKFKIYHVLDISDVGTSSSENTIIIYLFEPCMAHI